MPSAKPAIVGAAISLAGHGLAVGATMATAIALGGGPNADLDAGGRYAALAFVIPAYGAAQLALLGICVASWRRLGSASLPGIVVGWVLGLGAGTFYLCGGFGT